MPTCARMDDTQHDGHNDGPMQPGTPAISQEMADLLARVPYFAQTSPLNCGPTCLRMIAATCGPDPGIAAMEEASGIEKGKAVSTLDLVTAMGRVLAPQAADVVFCSLSPVFNEANMTHAFYQLHYDGSVEASEQQLAEVEAQGIQVSPLNASVRVSRTIGECRLAKVFHFSSRPVRLANVIKGT